MLAYAAWALLELEKRSSHEDLEAEHWLQYMAGELEMPPADADTIRELIRRRRAIRRVRGEQG